MDIFVKNQEIDNSIQNFCSEALYNYVLDAFALNGWVINDERFELTATSIFGVTVHSIWTIDNFINDEQVNIIDKVNVLMSYLDCNGCILWGRENYSGRYFAPFLQRLFREGYIDENENAEIFGIWTEYRNGRTERPHFVMNEID